MPCTIGIHSPINPIHLLVLKHSRWAGLTTLVTWRIVLGTPLDAGVLYWSSESSISHILEQRCCPDNVAHSNWYVEQQLHYAPKEVVKNLIAHSSANSRLVETVPGISCSRHEPDSSNFCKICRYLMSTIARPKWLTYEGSELRRCDLPEQTDARLSCREYG